MITKPFRVVPSEIITNIFCINHCLTVYLIINIFEKISKTSYFAIEILYFTIFYNKF